MVQSLSNDLRARLIACVEGGMSARAAGRKLEIAASSATGIVKDWRDRGCFKPLKRGGFRRSILQDHTVFIEAMVDKHGDWTEDEYCAHLKAERGVYVHPSTVGRFIRKMGYRYKKNTNRKRAAA